MTFLHPSLAIAGAMAVALPIIIHLLLRRRRKVVPWAAMRFVIEAYQRQRSRLRLEQFLLLLARCLLVACAAAAIAQPLIGASAASSRGPVWLTLVIDNSLTSQLTAEDGSTALDRHKAAARGLLSKLSQERGDRVGLVTLASPADAITLPPSSDLAAVGSLIDAIEPSDAAADARSAFDRIRSGLDSVENQPSSTVAIFSDFRAGSFDPAAALPPLGNRATLAATAPASTAIDNTAVVALVPLRRTLIGGGETVAVPVRVDLKRFGPGLASEVSAKINLTVRPSEPGAAAVPVGSGVVRFAAGRDSASTSIPVSIPSPKPGERVILTASIDRDALPADNTAQTILPARQRLSVAILAPRPTRSRPTVESFRPADWVALALAPERDGVGPIRISYVPPTSAGGELDLAPFDAVFVTDPALLTDDEWKALRTFGLAGGVVIVFPSPSAASQSWFDLAAQSFDWPFQYSGEVVELPTPAALDKLDQTPAADSLQESLLGLVWGELPDLGSVVRVSQSMKIDSSAEHVLLSDAAGPLILASPFADDAKGGRSKGITILFAAPLDLAWTDLPAKPLLVPLLQELVRQGVGRASSDAVATAGSLAAAPDRSTELRLIGIDRPQSKSAPAEAMSFRPDQPLRRAGVYLALDDRQRPLGSVLVAPDLAASDPSPQSREVILPTLSRAVDTPGSDDAAPSDAGPRSTVQWLTADFDPSREVATTASADARGPSPWSLPLLIAAAVFAVAELLLARVVSHASRSGAASDSISIGGRR